MKVQDAFRAQYFLACLEREAKQSERALSHISFFSSSLHDILKICQKRLQKQF